jgi:hypothetical protein
MINKILTFIGLVSINSVSAINPFLPDCVVNYTTYFNRYANESAINIENTITDISGDDCGSKCNNLYNCTSFNFFPQNIFYPNSQSKCELISTDFNSSLLIDKFYSGYYLKSNNNCIEEREKYYLIIIGVSLLLIFLISIICCVCCKKRNRSSYHSLG